MNMRDLFLCGHQWTRELVQKYNVSYKAQFALCVRELVRQKKNGECNLF